MNKLFLFSYQLTYLTVFLDSSVNYSEYIDYSLICSLEKSKLPALNLRSKDEGEILIGDPYLYFISEFILAKGGGKYIFLLF